MTRTEKNIKICEALGWKGCTDAKCAYRKAQHLHDAIGHVCFPESFSIPRYPDHFTCLNAMHKAEKTLTRVQLATYQDWLVELSIADRPRLPILMADADKRAEAFGKTMGLW